MPARIETTADSLVVHIEGADKLWALKSQLDIPLAHVLDARPARDDAHKWLHGIRLGGTHIPGVISAGRFHSDGSWVFWDVHDADKAIGIELEDERYDKLVIEVTDPETEIARIRKAKGTR
jgi:hypothetical protein